LVKESFSKLFPGLLKDMGDWTVDTRRQAAKLMLTLLRYERDNATMHLQQVCSTVVGESTQS
jgi:dynein assembly factor 5